MRYLTTNVASLYREHPVSTLLGFVAAAVTGGAVSALLFHSDGYAMSAAVGRGVAVAALTLVGLLVVRWVHERLAARGATDNVDHAGSPSGDGG